MEHHIVPNKEKLLEHMEGHPVGLVAFSASWCGPCKVLHPQLEGLSAEPTYKSVKFLHIDVDESGELAEVMNIQAMPTVMIFKGTEVKRTVIGSNIEKIEAALKEVLKE